MSLLTRSRPVSRVVTLIIALAAFGGTLSGWGGGTADATAYRYWSYWLGTDAGWTFSTQGAARRPADGTVDGWRFAVSEATSSSTPPRREPSFDRLCGTTEPVEGSKRVGLVVDFGTSADAPGGESPPAMLARCVVVPDDANGYDVLVAAVTLRTQDGLICGMDGYPATECGAPVTDPTPTQDDPGGSDEPGRSGGSGHDDSASGSGGGGSAGPDEATSSSGPAPSATEAADDDATERAKGKRDAKDPGAEPSQSEDAAPVAAPVGAATAPAAGDSSSPAGVLVGVALIAALAAGAWVVRRRRT